MSYKRFGEGDYKHQRLMRPILLDVVEELFPDEKWIVHHKDGDKTNNDIFNLKVMTNSEHTRLHMTGNIYATGNQNQKGKILDKSPNWGKGTIDNNGGINELRRLKNNGLLKREVAELFGCCTSNIEYYLKRRKTRWSDL